MKTLYLDIFSGISGDMLLGALIDLGVKPAELGHELKKLALEGYHLHVAPDEKSHIRGIKFDVHVHEHHEHGKAEHSHDDKHEHEHTHDDGVTHTHSHSHGHEHSNEHEHHHHPEQGHEHSHEHEHEDEHHHVHGRNFADIKQLIQKSALSNWVKEKSINVFHRIAVAEGKIHGKPAEQVHFHEVGAVDSIVDI
ncbi:MAG TPA: nickel insertion protein, partial [Verrucomicrobiae bacterium]|nr:nickel insertion protein [Verrucomicrobiae bacterium]